MTLAQYQPNRPVEGLVSLCNVYLKAGKSVCHLHDSEMMYCGYGKWSPGVAYIEDTSIL